MKKRRFLSRLFGRYIEPEEYDFFPRVHAELLFRIKELEEKNCSCMGCQAELEKYYNALDKLRKPPPKNTV